MSIKPKVTVAIPTYNRAHYLKEAIDSVLNQTFQDYELLILDNASTDNTSEVVSSYKDERIQYVRNENNIGPINNFNKAIDLANGDYLIIFHDDDIMLPQLLEKEAQVLDNNENVVLVCSNVCTIDKYRKILKRKRYKIEKDIEFNKYDYIYTNFRYHFSFIFPTVLMRIDFINEKKIKFCSLAGRAADNYMWFEINTYDKKLIFLNNTLLKYTVHEYPIAESVSMRIINNVPTLYKPSLDLIKKNKIEYIVPYLKRNITNAFLSECSYYLVHNLMNKRDVIRAYKILKSEELWTNNVCILSKLKLIVCYYLPIIGITLYNVKRFFKNKGRT